MERDKNPVETFSPLAERTTKLVRPTGEAMKAIVASEAERLRLLDRLLIDAFGPDGSFK